MTLSNLKRGLLQASLSLGLAFLATAGVASCKKQSGTASPAATASNGGNLAKGASKAADACEEYASRLCEKAGTESSTCQAIRTSTELMPKAACSAGLKEIDYSFKKLAQVKSPCDEIVSKLCAEVGEKTQTCELVKTQTKQFPPERCTTMLQHVPEIVADLKRMEQANKPLDAKEQQAISEGSPPSFGPENAKVVIVEFSDFQCPYCSHAAGVVHQVREKYSSRVRFIFRQFPLPMHPQAKEAAEASLAAHAQGKFWEFHDRLFKNQQKLERAELEEHAKQTGLNLATFRQSLDQHKYAALVDADLKLGERVQVQGTPAMFINGARVANPTSFEAVSEIIETALRATAPG